VGIVRAGVAVGQFGRGGRLGLGDGMAAFDGKVAIVTGGTRGIGRAIAAGLVGAGASVVVAGRRAETVEAAVAELGSGAAGRVRGVVADVRRPEECGRLVAEAVGAFGRLDVLVNNAGVGVFGEVESLDPEEWRSVLATNLDGPFYCVRAAMPHLKRTGGWVVNIGSLAGRNPFAGGAAYCASKAGLIAFSEALMQEVRHAGVRVACVLPGSVFTEFPGPARGGGEEWKLWPEDVARAVLDLLAYPPRALPSLVELRPARPPRR